MTIWMALLIALASDTAPARVEIAELPGGVFLVGWDDLVGSGALAFRRELDADEARYLPIGGAGPFAILDRGRRTLVSGTSVPVYDIAIDADHPERMRLDAGRKVDLAALTAKYEAFEHVAPAGEGKSAIETAITAELARANKACGGKLAASIDWAAFGKAQRLAKQTVGILEALATTCADKDYAAAVKTIATLRVGYRSDGGALQLVRTGATLAVTFSDTSFNPRETATTWLDKNL